MNSVVYSPSGFTERARTISVIFLSSICLIIESRDSRFSGESSVTPIFFSIKKYFPFQTPDRSKFSKSEFFSMIRTLCKSRVESVQVGHSDLDCELK